MTQPDTSQTATKTLCETLALGCNIVAMEGCADISMPSSTTTADLPTLSSWWVAR